ncbi:MAG: START domain-containing protein [Bacteroidales bacterium]
MRYARFLSCCLFLLLLSTSLKAQSWNFIKEKDGIKIFTRKEAGKSLKAYKGVADVNAPAEKVFAMIENVNNTDWWDKNFNHIKVLRYEKNKRAQYYLIYDLPWPVNDRDLCVDVTVTVDPVSGVRRVIAGPLPGLVPENPDLIRIKEYHQTWTVKPTGKSCCNVVLEGYVDPAGTIPDWLTNMLIVDSPINVITGVKERMEK